jgi:hypothetical protein
MSSFGQINAMMEQLAGKLDCQAIAEFEKRQAWILVLDDAIAFEINFDERAGLIHVVAELAPLPDAQRPALMTLLLQYNDQWQRTGGLRIGLAAEDSALSLMASFPASNVEPTAFARRLLRLAEAVTAWRELIAQATRDAGNVISDTLSIAESFSSQLLIRP